MNTNAKVECRTPTPGAKATRIDLWKYNLIREKILKVVPRRGDGVLFGDLPEMIAQMLSEEEKRSLGSVSWYTTTVKLDLEVRQMLHRVEGAKPQRLLRA